ncbi:Uncharacterized protein XB17_02719 [Leptospira santarosai]|nr:Uncharacterized protein XB17_02719 [Leptospira santarosai]
MVGQRVEVRGSILEMKQLKVIIEKHADGYVSYPLGLKGVVVGQGDSYEEALSDVKSAIRFHIETFGEEVFEEESPVMEAFIAEAEAVD